MTDKIIDWMFFSVFVLILIFGLSAIGLSAYQGDYIVTAMLSLVIMPVVMMVVLTYVAASK